MSEAKLVSGAGVTPQGKNLGYRELDLPIDPTYFRPGPVGLVFFGVRLSAETGAPLRKP